MAKMERIKKIKDKFGKNAFKHWGRLGGNPLLLAQGQHKKIIIVK